MKKLSVVGTILVLLLSWASLPCAQQDIQVRSNSDITVIYVGRDGCNYCREWKLWELPAFEKLQEARHVEMILIDKGHSRYRLKARDYPEKYRHLYEEVPGFGGPVPAWLVVVDSKLVLVSVGWITWKREVMPEIKRLVALKLATLAEVDKKKIADASAR